MVSAWLLYLLLLILLLKDDKSDDNNDHININIIVDTVHIAAISTNTTIIINLIIISRSGNYR